MSYCRKKTATDLGMVLVATEPEFPESAGRVDPLE